MANAQTDAARCFIGARRTLLVLRALRPRAPNRAPRRASCVELRNGLAIGLHPERVLWRWMDLYQQAVGADRHGGTRERRDQLRRPVAWLGSTITGK